MLKIEIMKKIILFVLIVIANYTGTFAQKPGVVLSDKEGWHKIGETTVDFKTETDEIMVMGADKFGFVKIKIDDAPINLISFKIYLEDGDEQNVLIGEEVKARGETRTVPLNNGEREIKKVVFIYKTVPNAENKKAHVELWGMKTNSDKKAK